MVSDAVLSGAVLRDGLSGFSGEGRGLELVTAEDHSSSELLVELSAGDWAKSSGAGS